MILKTKVPGRVVQRRVRKPGGGYRIKPWFRFDENGLAEIDESKLTKSDIIKLKQKFEVVERKSNAEEKKEEETKEVLTEDQLRSMAKAAGIKSWHVKSVKTLKKELGV